MWVRRTAVSATAEGVAHVRRCSSLARVVYERFALYSESSIVAARLLHDAHLRSGSGGGALLWLPRASS